MGIRDITDEDIDKVYESSGGARRLSALDASLPQYLSMQAGGVEAAGDIFGIETPGITGIKEQQERALSGFRSRHQERLLESEQPFEWWKEKASLNAMNTVAPMLGFAVGNVLKAVPHPVAKALGTVINYGTFATTYNANFADTLDEHTQLAGRELSNAEKVKSAGVAVLATYLDTLAPIKGAAATGKLITKTFGKGGVSGAKDNLKRLLKTERDSILKQIGKSSKFVGKVAGIEMGTEAAQKALQIGTSVQPERLGTFEGLQDIVEEAVIAGPISGAVSVPGGIGVGREQNRDLSTARRLAEGFNRDILRGESPTSQTEAALLTIPEGRGFTPGLQQAGTEVNEFINKRTGFDVAQGLGTLSKTLAFKPLSDLIKIRNSAKTGKEFHSANAIFQMFSPTGSGSGEAGVGQNFFSIRETQSGKYLKDVINVLNTFTNKKRGVGGFGSNMDPNISNYIIESLDTADKADGNRAAISNALSLLPSGTDVALLNKGIEVIRGKLDSAHKDMTDSGIDIGFIEGYLHRPISVEAVKGNVKEFAKDLERSSKEAAKVTKSDKFHEITYEEALAIGEDIVNGVDPDLVSAKKLIGKDKKFSGDKKKSFEQSRAESWKFLDPKYRDRNIDNILTSYLTKAASRVASARVFGKDAFKLEEQIDALADTGKINQSQINKIYDVYDATHNIYKRVTTPETQNLRVLSKIGTTIGAATHLGLATLSSLTELAWVGERAGFGHMMGTLPSALKYSVQGIRRGASGKYIEPGEGATTLATLGFNLDPKVNERLDQLFSTDKNSMLSAYFRSPLGGFLTQWTNFNRNWAAQAMMSNINHRANGLRDGSITDIEKRRLENELKENGISEATFKEITDRFRGEDGVVRVDITRDDILDGVLTTRDTRVKTAPNKYYKKGKRKGQLRKKEEFKDVNVTVRDVLIPWLHKVVDDVVVTPKATNKPLWMSNPSLALIAQLKTFPIVFGNTVVKRLLRKLNPKQCSPDYGAAVGVIGGIAMAYALAHIGEMLKDAIRESEDRDPPGFQDTLNKIGLTGAVGLVAESGRYHGGAFTSFAGTGAGFINTAFEDIITPLWNMDGEVDVTDNILEWTGSSIDNALGAAGIYFKPFEDN